MAALVVDFGCVLAVVEEVVAELALDRIYTLDPNLFDKSFRYYYTHRRMAENLFDLFVLFFDLSKQFSNYFSFNFQI